MKCFEHNTFKSLILNTCLIFDHLFPLICNYHPCKKISIIDWWRNSKVLGITIEMIFVVLHQEPCTIEIYDIFDLWYICNFVLYLMQLATEMLRLFDPTLDQQTAPPEESLNLIPIYRNPKIQGGILPGTSVLSVVLLFGEDAGNRNSIRFNCSLALRSLQEAH